MKHTLPIRATGWSTIVTFLPGDFPATRRNFSPLANGMSLFGAVTVLYKYFFTTFTTASAHASIPSSVKWELSFLI